MIHINLLPWREEMFARRKRELVRSAIFVIVLAAMIVIVMLLVITIKLSFQNARNNYLRAQIAAIQSQYSEFEKVKKTRTDLIEKINKIQDLHREQYFVVKFLNGLVSIVPEDVKLLGVLMSGSKMTITGTSHSYEAVNNFLRNIKTQDYLTSPEITHVTNERVDGVPQVNFVLIVHENRDRQDLKK